MTKKIHNHYLSKKHRTRVPHRRAWGPAAGPARRVFIGIRINGDTCDALAELQEGLPPIPMRKVPKVDLHLTLTPPWMEKDVPAAAQRMRDALERPFSFELKFRRLRYGPDPADPFLIWVTVEASKELIELKKRLLKAFGKQKNEKVPFTPHVTLARLKGETGGGAPTQGRTERRRGRHGEKFFQQEKTFGHRDSFREHHLRKVVPLTMTVEAVELMESTQKGTGVGYTTIKRVRLPRVEETPQ